MKYSDIVIAMGTFLAILCVLAIYMYKKSKQKEAYPSKESEVRYPIEDF